MLYLVNGVINSAQHHLDSALRLCLKVVLCCRIHTQSSVYYKILTGFMTWQPM